MNVLVPLNNLEHLKEYMEAGALEFYMGFYDEAWFKRFGQYADMNRLSGYAARANSNSFSDVLALIPKIKALGKYIYITFNSSIYSEEQIQYMRQYFEALKEAGADGVIVSCIELVKLAKECGIESVASTICGIYNSDIARVYYEAGAKRLILPRDLGVEEIISIIKNVPEAEYEVFMMRNGCVFSDANCLGLHRSENCAICSNLGRELHQLFIRNQANGHLEEVKETDRIYTKEFHKYSCGMCAIYDFVKAGVKAAKIVGRTDDWEYVCKDIKSVYENIKLAESSATREEYFEHMWHPEDREIMCHNSMSCYYPEIQFQN